MESYPLPQYNSETDLLKYLTSLERHLLSEKVSNVKQLSDSLIEVANKVVAQYRRI